MQIKVEDPTDLAVLKLAGMLPFRARLLARSKRDSFGKSSVHDEVCKGRVAGFEVSRSVYTFVDSVPICYSACLIPKRVRNHLASQEPHMRE